MADWQFMSFGGLLISGNGDIATTVPGTLDCTKQLLRTRIKANFNSWQLYQIGANLSQFAGNAISEELELTIQRNVLQSVADIVPVGSVDCETLVMPDGKTIMILVYFNGALLVSGELTMGANPQITVT